MGLIQFKMDAKLTFLLLVATCSLATGDKVFFKDCGSKTGKLTEVRITPCPQEPCNFKHNTTVTIEMDFGSMVNTTSVKAGVTGIIDHIPVPYPIPNTDGCTCGVKCPVKSGDINTYKYGLFVKPEYPTLKLVVQYELKDDKGNDLACGLIPVVISD